MGKQGKKHHDRRNSRSMRNDYDDPLPSSAYDPATSVAESSSIPEEEAENEDKYQELPVDGLSKFDLYQRSVQSPKGDITYMQKFFWTYVGGRPPLHLQEDFCGTAFLSAEWLRSDPRRTVVGVDLDVESLKWGLKHNVDKVGGDAYSRICLFHGNVLHSLSSAQLVNSTLLEGENNNSIGNAEFEPSTAIEDDVVSHINNFKLDNNENIQEYQGGKGSSWPAADVVCAFNYSCCCLKSRSDLVLYFKKALNAISNEGGIFVMDLYGGSSSEHALKFRRRYEHFTYIWEQEDFDIISRTTRISLHFNLNKMQRSYRHALSYQWRLPPYWQIGINVVAVCGPGFKTPSVEELGGPILNQRVADVQVEIKELREMWKKKGCTIMTDGWTDRRSRTLLNFLLSSSGYQDNACADLCLLLQLATKKPAVVAKTANIVWPRIQTNQLEDNFLPMYFSLWIILPDLLLRWTLPEIKDCLEEARFNSVHFWIREMPDIQGEEMEDYDVNDNVKYEEISSFKQQDAWNAYIVGVKNKSEAS